MKCNFLQFLKVVFISLLICSLSLLTLGIIWQQYIHIIEKNNLPNSNTNIFDKFNFWSQYFQNINHLGLIFGLFVLGLGILFFSVNRYIAYRTAEQQKIINKLEKIYHDESGKRLSGNIDID